MENLKNLASGCAREFYGLPLKERNCSIIVKGGNLSQKDNFMRALRPLVDVLVCDDKQFPNPVGQYVIDLNNYI